LFRRVTLTAFLIRRTGHYKPRAPNNSPSRTLLIDPIGRDAFAIIGDSSTVTT
jgi:hypothetical protein